MRVLVWHVHGSWLGNFVQGGHEYLVPRHAMREDDGKGVPADADWAPRTREVDVDTLRDERIDVVVAQRPRELDLVQRWTGRVPGHDLPTVYLEHNTPGGDVGGMRHPLADRDDIPIVHVTHFNDLFWDSGDARTTVIEHGVRDPGHRFTGSVPAACVSVNEPMRRGRAAGTDLIPAFAERMDVDVFGMHVNGLAEALGNRHVHEYEDLPQRAMHDEIAQRRVYVHPYRWTSLGLSLVEAMLLGLPVVVVAATEHAQTVPQHAGLAGTDLDRLVAAAAHYVEDPAAAKEAGLRAREYALRRFSLDRFLHEWDRLLQEVAQ